MEIRKKIIATLNEAREISSYDYKLLSSIISTFDIKSVEDAKNKFDYKLYSKLISSFSWGFDIKDMTTDLNKWLEQFR